MTLRDRLRRAYVSRFGLNRHERRLLEAIRDARPCAGCTYLLAEAGDTYCSGCRSALDAGGDVREWGRA